MPVFIVLLIAVGDLLRGVSSCTSNGIIPTTPLGVPDIATVLGGNAQIDSILVDRTGNEATIQQSSQLTCQTWDASCRWRNEPNGFNRDKFQWGRGVGTWDNTRGNLAFGTAAKPDQQWAVTGVNGLVQAADNAMLVSDPINCQQGNGELTMMYWTTQGATIRVCTREPNSGVSYTYCSPTIGEGDPGPAVVNIPGPIRRPFELVIEAKGFIANVAGLQGGIVVIDNVGYNAQGIGQCNRKEPEETVGHKTKKDDIRELCDAMACDFDGACANNILRGTDWQRANGATGNRHTGIRVPLEGDYAVATGPRSQLTLGTKPFTLNTDKLLQFCYYRPSALSNLAVIIDKGGIREKVFNTQALTSRSPQHQWLCDESVLLGPGQYDGIEFIAEGLQTRYSHLAIDNMQLFDVAAPDFPLC